MPTLILASSSPRRRDLLRSAGVALEVDPSEVDETLRPGEEPRAYARRMAYEKRHEGAARRADAAQGRPVLAADTIVVVQGRVLGKPADRPAARRMIRSLAGGEHEVITGCCLMLEGAPRWQEVVVTGVLFRELTDQEIERYLDRGEWGDKAGAYGIQGAAAHMVNAVHGSYTNVVGLPLAQVVAALAAAQAHQTPEERR